MKLFCLILAASILLSACQDEKVDVPGEIIAAGQMPNIITDSSGAIHLVYGNGDSVLYSSSTDGGNTFSTPALISVVPKLAASHSRGPQIAATLNGLTVTVCNDMGDIFSFATDETGNWSQGARVNDMDTVAKENLMALAGDGQNVFAVWLDLRDGHNKIFGSRSTDGGKSWSKNFMVYASPDKTVCECCKPSVAVKGKRVYIMFRNWLNGNRDLYLIQSSDSGNSFGQAEKLGKGSWALNGCPMDGGMVVVNNRGNAQTIWNRKGTIYSCDPGEEEKELGEGENCTMETVNGNNVYAWVEDGEIMVLSPKGIKKKLGKGQQPVLKAVNNEHILCIWEHEKQIHKTVLAL